MRRRKIGIRQLKNEVSRIVNEVREGEAEYVVTKRGVPVAILRPLTDSETAAESDEKRRAYAEGVMRMIHETAKELADSRAARELLPWFRDRNASCRRPMGVLDARLYVAIASEGDRFRERSQAVDRLRS